MIQIDTGYKDKKGQKIYLGQYAKTHDREGHEWVGIIDTCKTKCKENCWNGCKNNGIYVTRVFVFSSNIVVWLHSYWTEKKLEIIKSTDKIIKKYNEQKNLKWGHYYSKKTLKNYWK